ncbi:alkaline phosphatase family protein [Kitasatospora sp. NPDC058190]|uniref:alkaline phosphatase family protein n=1 Tax=Kitasatospora sp. NPDC058190 TaxID=3346371 RepID=UPI0036DB18AB
MVLPGRPVPSRPGHTDTASDDGEALNHHSGGAGAPHADTEPTAGFSWTTYAERLEAAGISWKVYQQSDNFDDNALAWFANFKNAKPGSPLHDKGMATVPDLVAAFQKDVDAGTLPQVSWIVTPASLSEHANYKPAYGEDLSARLLKVLAADQSVWSQTAFILNYDENGGFFDHVPPPIPPVSSSQGISSVPTTGEISGGQAIGMGPRVPLIVVSPWTRGGYVNSHAASPATAPPPAPAARRRWKSPPATTPPTTS